MYDGKLFGRYTRDACVRQLTDLVCQFTDDSGLVSSTRRGTVSRIMSYQEVVSKFDLTVSSCKLKNMVTGRLAEDRDREPIKVDGCQIECEGLSLLRIAERRL